MGGLVVGGAYNVEQRVGTTTVVPTSTVFQNEMHPDSAKWKLAAQEAKAIHRMRAMERKAAKDDTDIYQMTLSEAATWINGVWGTTRAARLAVILKAIGAA
jgi:hypothetical protein